MSSRHGHGVSDETKEEGEETELMGERKPIALFMAFGTKGDIFPIAALAAAFACDQKQYKVSFVTHSAHQGLSANLAAKNVTFIPISSPPVLAAHQHEQLSDSGASSIDSDKEQNDFSLQKMFAEVEHRRECLTASESVFGNDLSNVGDFIAINFFALEGWHLAELFQVRCIVTAPYVVPYSAPSSFEYRFKKDLPLLYKYFQGAPVGTVGWKDVLHWMWPLFMETWGSWRNDILNLSSLPFMDPVTNLPLWHMRIESPLLLIYAVMSIDWVRIEQRRKIITLPIDVNEVLPFRPIVRVPDPCYFMRKTLNSGFPCKDICRGQRVRVNRYGFSKEVVECPGYWPPNVYTCGFWFLPMEWQFSCERCIEAFSNSSNIPPVLKDLCPRHASLQDFLNRPSDSSSPIFVGLSSIGSMGFLTNPKAFLAVLQKVIEATKYRFVLFTSGYEPLDVLIRHLAYDAMPNSAPMLEETDSTLLFDDRLFCFSGGTTAAALLAGIPQVVCPFLLDQFYWAEKLCWMKVAPNPLPRHFLCPGSLDDASISAASDALWAAIDCANSSEVKSQAAHIAQKISSEDGIGEALKILRDKVVPQ